MTQANLREIVWQVVASIPEGKVATYGQVAKIAGYPSQARYVGATLRNLPKNTALPWHRVINAQGRISFPSDSEAYKR
jgi:methylated-DNA-protein-cysteine methyltransferase-like protein